MNPKLVSTIDYGLEDGIDEKRQGYEPVYKYRGIFSDFTTNICSRNTVPQLDYRC
jgi:hypothetical protein